MTAQHCRNVCAWTKNRQTSPNLCFDSPLDIFLPEIPKTDPEKTSAEARVTRVKCQELCMNIVISVSNC